MEYFFKNIDHPESSNLSKKKLLKQCYSQVFKTKTNIIEVDK